MADSLKTSVQDQMEDLMECSICTEIYANPKSLPCLNSFCLKCLEQYGNKKKPGEQITCPICRSISVIPNGGFVNLPNNFFINKMVEIRKLSGIATGETVCSTCPQEEKVKAKMFCFECEQQFCERCGATHSKMKLSQHHQVVELGCKPQEIIFRNCHCDQHPEEQVKMYCEVDKATICFLCFAESHQTHKCLSIAKASEEFSPALKNGLKAVKRRLPVCTDSLDKLKKLKIGLCTEATEAEKKIASEATRLKALIDSHVDVLTQKLTAIKDKKLKEIERTQQDVERYQIMIESYARYLDELLNKGAPGDICHEADRMKTRAKELTPLPEICCGCEWCSDKIAFKSSNFEDVLRSSKIDNVIGDVEVRSSSSRLLGHAKGTYKRGHMGTATGQGVVYEEALEEQQRTPEISNQPSKKVKRKATVQWNVMQDQTW